MILVAALETEMLMKYCISYLLTAFYMQNDVIKIFCHKFLDSRPSDRSLSCGANWRWRLRRADIREWRGFQWISVEVLQHQHKRFFSLAAVMFGNHTRLKMHQAPLVTEPAV